jgi:hypothetical protein
MAQAIARLPDYEGLDELEGLNVIVDGIKKQRFRDPNRIVQALARRLAKRLSIENHLRNHPEIHDEAIDSPLFVAGMPRAGTTLVQTLLALDPMSKYLRMWELWDPCPPPELIFHVADPRIFEFQRSLDEWKKHNPTFETIHPLDAGRPQECQEVLALDFKSTSFPVVWALPEYTEWLLECDMTSAYRFHREVLKLLQSRNPGGTWVLKAPMHSMCLPTIQQVHKSPKFILCHRDPVAAVASASSATFQGRSAAYESVDPKQVGRETLSRLSTYVSAIDRTRHLIPEKDVYDLRYSDLVADPIATIRAIYDRFGLELNNVHRRRMSVWLRSSGGSRGQHRYSIDDFGMSAAVVRAQFSHYIEHYRLAVD